MERVFRPRVPENPPPVLTQEQKERLLATCRVTGPGSTLTAKRFRQIRDRAAILMLYATSARREELAGMETSQLDVKEREITVRGKGDKVRTGNWSPDGHVDRQRGVQERR
jgi:site-specific recombinase XerD